MNAVTVCGAAWRRLALMSKHDTKSSSDMTPNALMSEDGTKFVFQMKLEIKRRILTRESDERENPNRSYER